MDTLGERIKKIRMDNNLTQAQFAEKISVSRPFISRIESDKEKPSESLIKLICATFRIKKTWLSLGYGTQEQPVVLFRDMKEAFFNNTYIEKIMADSDYESTNNLAMIFSVVSSILQNNNIKKNSQHFYQEQIKGVLILIDYYIKQVDVEDIFEWMTEAEKCKQRKTREKEFFDNLDLRLKNAQQALQEDDLDEITEDK